MSKHQRNAAGATVALAALGATAGLAPDEGDPGALPDASAGPENAAAEFVASDVVAERDALRAENERLAGQLADARADLERERAEFDAQRDELHDACDRRLADQCEKFEVAWAERERRVAALASNQGAPAPVRTRPVFDASYACAVDGKRVTFSPGDPVPDHIDPAELPAGAWRLAPEEG